MEGRFSNSLWRLIAAVWMCVEVGQFVGENTPFGQDRLFWPFWICLTLVLYLGSFWLDAQWRRNIPLE